MNIVLYLNASEPNVVAKVITVVATLTGSLREPSSVTNPVIRIEMGNPVEANYVHIPDFNRYYYIDDIVSLRTNLWELHLKVDVLMSFASSIKNSLAVVEETSLEGDERVNSYVSNDSFARLVKDKTDIIQFPDGFNEQPYFILITAGGIVS